MSAKTMNLFRIPAWPLALAATAAFGQAPGITSCQDNVTVGGNRRSGTRQFQFALVNAAGPRAVALHDPACCQRQPMQPLAPPGSPRSGLVAGDFATTSPAPAAPCDHGATNGRIPGEQVHRPSYRMPRSGL